MDALQLRAWEGLVFHPLRACTKGLFHSCRQGKLFLAPVLCVQKVKHTLVLSCPL